MSKSVSLSSFFLVGTTVSLLFSILFTARPPITYISIQDPDSETSGAYLNLSIDVSFLGRTLFSQEIDVTESENDFAEILTERVFSVDLAGQSVKFEPSSKLSELDLQSELVGSDIFSVRSGTLNIYDDDLWRLGELSPDDSFTLDFGLDSTEFGYRSTTEIDQNKTYEFTNINGLDLGTLIINDEEIALGDISSFSIYFDDTWSVPTYYIIDIRKSGLGITVKPVLGQKIKQVNSLLEQSSSVFYLLKYANLIFLILGLLFFILYKNWSTVRGKDI